MAKKKVEKVEKLKIECKICKRELVASANTYFLSREGSKYDNEEYGRYMPICKKCSKEYILDANGNVDEDRFKYILSELDKVFVPTEFFNVKTKHSVDKVLGEYLNVINSCGGKYKDYGYGQSIQFEFQNDIIKKQNLKIDDKMIEFWGKDLPLEKYYIYQKEFDRLIIEDGGDINSIKENYFKNIAILRDTASEQLLANNLKDYDTTMKVLTGICEKCGINPKQVQESSNRGTYGAFIKVIENEQPIEDWNKMMGSLDLVKRCLQVFFFGHLAEVMGFKNPLKVKYDEVMQEYSVKTDTWEDLMNIEENDEEDSSKNRRILRASKFRRKSNKDGDTYGS